ncbi:class F sortase [Janibacter sp. G349]|uniref:class F sortase n=1 Tax=Janibacter sp. G349 TaxID=3405424 RepID=UPI003B77C504
MRERTRGRGRRAQVVTVAVVALAVAGGGLTAFGLSQQETRMPPPAAVSEGGHAGHGRSSTSSLPSASPTSGSGHAGHHMGPGTSSPASPSAAAPATTARMARSRPTSVSIPSLGVTSSVIDLGLQPDDTMEVPQDATSTGWFTGSPTPGELGPAVLAGHVTWDKRPAVFFELGSMRDGQRVEVSRADGSTAVFEVTDVGQYPKTDFPTDEVYGEVDHAALRLITCGGHFDGETGHHVDNVVVYAELVDER